MNDRIERFRARLAAAREGCPVHVGCGGEVVDTDDGGDACLQCGATDSGALATWSTDDPDYVADVGYLLRELDRARSQADSYKTASGVFEHDAHATRARANVEIEHLEKVIDNVERERDEAIDQLHRARRDRGSLLAFIRDRQRAAVAGGDDAAAEIMLGFLRQFNEGR